MGFSINCSVVKYQNEIDCSHRSYWMCSCHPKPLPTRNMDQLTVLEFQTTTHTKNNNMDQLTDSEFQDNTTTRVTTTNNNTGQPTESESQTTIHTKSNNMAQLTD